MHPPLAILVPCLRRPHRAGPLVESVVSATQPPVVIYFIAESNDWAEQAAISDAACGRPVVTFVQDGNYASKINHAVGLTDEPLVFLGADDIDFRPGWLDIALAAAGPGIGVVGTNDLCNPRTATGEHSTHSLMTRSYAQQGTIDDPSKVLHEGYPHEFVDDEFIATAKARSAYAHAPDSVVEHLHPMVGKAPMDDLYSQQHQRMRYGRRLYARRKHLWET